jgi:hypothetical protein
MKKTLFVLTLVMVAAMFLVAAAPSFQALARLTVINNTGDTAYMVLDGEFDDVPVHYYLTIPEGTKTFTVERTEFDVKYSMCGFFNESATLNMATNVKLNLRCDPSWKTFGTADPTDDELNWGEPSMEKVYPEDILEKEAVSGWRWEF